MASALTETETMSSAVIPMQFEGIGLLGYDNVAQEYVQLWLDNFMTGVIHLKGSADDSGKQITIAGKITKPMAGGEQIDVRWVYTIVNQNTIKFEMWEPDAQGNEYLHGEIVYTRVP